MKEIEYVLERKNVKNINIRVRKGQVYVSAKEEIPKTYIDQLVKSRASWIEKAVERQESLKKEKEGLYLLGQKVDLDILKGPVNKWEEDEERLKIYLKDTKDCKRLGELINKWQREKASLIFTDSLRRMLDLGKIQGEVELNYRLMKSRWGTCYPSRKKIIINTRLVEREINLIDYVILHELVHLLHPNHGRAFYKKLLSLMPDYKDREKLLGLS